uniref:Chondroitin proteoglycan 4 domain-containing protein n=1 Tax=Trichuris muris TaxID=70415 RepID=A0A5S6R1R8_TRIMR
MVTSGCFLAASLLLVTLLDGANGNQACNGEFNKFKNCMTGAFDRVVHRSDIEAKMDQAKRCFESARCNMSGHPFARGPHPPPGHHQCRKQVFDELGQEVEKCVQNKFPGFSFSELFLKKRPGEGPKGFHMPAGGRKIGKLFRIMRDPNVCPPEVRDQVSSCLRPIVDEAKGAMKSYVTQLCAEKDQCMASMSPTCKQQFDSLKKEVVNCACGHLEPNAAKYAHEFLSCVGKTDRPNEMFKKMIEGFIPKFCQRMKENPDICQNLQGFFAGRHHHFGRHPHRI